MSRRFRSLILCYHAASDTWPCGLSLAPHEIERQLRGLLRRGYRPATAAETLSGERGRLHVTFDDAYRSVWSLVPALERFGVRATVFACSAYADDGRSLDIPELAEENAAHPGESETMDWDALRELADRGHEIGSHTVTHPHLTELSDGDLDRELRESRERIATELRRPCRFVSYPYGDEDERVQRSARAVGYDAAFALPGRDAPVNLHALPRVGVYRRDTGLRFKLKTTALARRAASLRA